MEREIDDGTVCQENFSKKKGQRVFDTVFENVSSCVMYSVKSWREVEAKQWELDEQRLHIESEWV